MLNKIVGLRNKNTVMKRAIVNERLNEFIDMSLDNSDKLSDMLDLFSSICCEDGDCDVSLFNFEINAFPVLVGTTIYNEDDVLYITNELMRLKKRIISNKVAYIKKLELEKDYEYRKGINDVRIVLLTTGDEVIGFLIIEMRTEAFLDKYDFQYVYKIFSLCLKNYILAKSRKETINMDPVTSLFGREKLIEKLETLKDISDRKEKTLCVIRIDNLLGLYSNKETADALLLNITKLLKEFAVDSYKTSLLYFAFVSTKDYIDVNQFVLHLKGLIVKKYQDITISAAIAQLDNTGIEQLIKCEKELMRFELGKIVYVSTSINNYTELSSAIEKSIKPEKAEVKKEDSSLLDRTKKSNESMNSNLFDLLVW